MASPKSTRAGTWIVISALVVFLLLSIAFMYVGWGPSGGPAEQQMSTGGYVAMTLGVIVTLGLGVGLMALIFYSNRRGHDHDATLKRRE